MPSRRVIFVFSVLLAVAAHYLFWFYAAPHIALVSATSPGPELARRYKVSLSEPVVEERTRVFERSATRLASRPGEIRDLVMPSSEPLSFPIEEDSAPAAVPDLESRLASDTVEREYAFEPDLDVLRRVDARIIEIAGDVARRDLEAPRRVVRPSPMNVIEDDEFPAMRGLLSDTDTGPVRLPSRPQTLLADHVPGSPPAEPDGESPPNLGAVRQEEIPEPPAVADNVPVLERSEIVAPPEPVMRAVREEQQTKYAFMDDLLDIRLETYQPPGEELGYFRLRISPKEGQAIESLPKDVTFIIDASKSISQRKLDVSVRGVGRIIASLQPQDYFNVVVFRDTPSLFQSAHVPGTEENKAAAQAYIKGLESRGETDVYKAIEPVIGMDPRPGVPGILFLVSDGRPTTGMRDSRTIINGLTADNRRNTVFAFGGGKTVNRYLLDLIAYRNKGESYVVNDIESIEKNLPRFFERIREPLLVDLQADYGRIDKSSVYPSSIPDFYRGRSVTVCGRFDPARDREFVMRLAGRAGDKKKEVIFRADLSVAQSGDREIARDWAFAKCYHLIGEISRQGEQAELIGQLRELSRTYGFKTSYDE